jgi:hypothetical protein
MKSIRFCLPLALSLLVFFCTLSQTWAATYHVGPGRDMKTLGAVLPRLNAGDIVEIDPGVYPETAKLAFNGTRDKPVIIRGVGATRPVFDAQGLDTSGRRSMPRGIFQIEGAYIIIEHLEFKNARNEQNAAGIRLLDSTNVVIRDCKITQCDMGIFGGDHETALIENCEIAFNGTEKFSGGSHNLYMHGNRVVVRNCYLHDSLFGQNYKSRAHYNELWWNWITDSNEGEVGFVDARGETDLPHSNALMVGNVVVSKRERAGNAAKFVLFGSEMGPDVGGVHDGTLFLFHNTFIAGTGRIQFIILDDSKARVVVQNNVFLNSNQVLHLARPALSVVGNRNLLPPTAALPQGWVDKPEVPLQYTDGEGVMHTLELGQSALIRPDRMP